jgi:hypothetical protein
LSDHNDIVEKLAQQFTKRGFKPQTKENNLPTGAGRDETIYRPDIIVRNSDGEIIWMVEVETSEGGKAIVGAAVLADVCMDKMSVRNKPKLLFVFYRSEANLKLAEKRLLALKGRITNVELMSPLSEKRALEQISAA